jgi:hypothetical protein
MNKFDKLYESLLNEKDVSHKILEGLKKMVNENFVDVKISTDDPDFEKGDPIDISIKSNNKWKSENWDGFYFNIEISDEDKSYDGLSERGKYLFKWTWSYTPVDPYSTPTPDDYDEGYKMVKGENGVKNIFKKVVLNRLKDLKRENIK